MGTGSIPHQRDSLQNSIDYAREHNASDYEIASITKDIMRFNNQLETIQTYWYPKFTVFIHEDVLEVEPIR